MAVINRESRCICWAAAVAFFLLSIGLFYYFFVQTSSSSSNSNNNNASGFNPKSLLPTIPIPTNKSSVHGLPMAKEDSERHSKNLVDLINNHPNRSWVAELNPSAVGLTVLDQAAFVISNDTIDDEIIKTLQDFSEVLKSDLFTEYYEKHVTHLHDDISFIPEYFDSSEKWPLCSKTILEIWDQGGCGSCWAVSAATLITDRICISTNGTQQKKVSAQDLLECCYFCGSCNGTLDPFTPFIYWYEHGIHSDECYPYTIATDCGHPCLPDVFLNPKGLGQCRGRKLCKRPGEQAKYVYKITSINPAPMESQRSLSDVYFEKFGANIEPSEILKREILKYGPVVLCFNVFEGFMHYKKGVYNLLNGAEGAHIYDHCVKIIGWGRDPATGRDYLKAINSWSSQWATDGTFLIDLEMLKHLRSDLYAGIPRI